MKRKWFIVILILAIVAVVLTIVFINLFRERDTRSLANNINSVVVEGYLNDESDEYRTINEYLDTIYPLISSQEERAEIQNMQNTYKAYVVYGEFVNKQFVFSTYTNVYREKSRNVSRNFSRAQNSANSLENYIEENRDVTSGSDFWTANSWANCKQYMQDLFTYTVNAFDNLGDIYTSCVTSPTMNNDLTALVFETAKALADDTVQNVTTAGHGASLLNFVNNYLTPEQEDVILEYIYNTTAQGNVKIITEQTEGWEEVYNRFLAGAIA